jgi:hypothetical protein
MVDVAAARQAYHSTTIPNIDLIKSCHFLAIPPTDLPRSAATLR